MTREREELERKKRVATADPPGITLIGHGGGTIGTAAGNGADRSSHCLPYCPGSGAKQRVRQILLLQPLSRPGEGGVWLIWVRPVVALIGGRDLERSQWPRGRWGRRRTAPQRGARPQGLDHLFPALPGPGDPLLNPVGATAAGVRPEPATHR